MHYQKSLTDKSVEGNSAGWRIPTSLMSTTIGLCFLPYNASCGGEERGLVDCLNDDALTAESGIRNFCSKLFRRKSKASSKSKVDCEAPGQNQNFLNTQHIQKIHGIEDLRSIVCGTPIQDAALWDSQFKEVKRFLHEFKDYNADEIICGILHEAVEKGNLKEAFYLARFETGEFWLTLSDFQSFETQLDLMLNSTCEDVEYRTNLMYNLTRRVGKPQETVNIESLEGLVSRCMQKIEDLRNKYPDPATQEHTITLNSIFKSARTFFV